MIDHTHLVSTGMRNKDMVVITIDAPDTGSTSFRFVNNNGTDKLLLFRIDDTESARIHPSLLQLRSRYGETSQIMRHIYIFAVRRNTNATQSITTVCQLNIFHFGKTIHFNHGNTGCHIIQVRTLCRQEVCYIHIFTVFAEYGGFRFAKDLNRA